MTSIFSTKQSKLISKSIDHLINYSKIAFYLQDNIVLS